MELNTKVPSVKMSKMMACLLDKRKQNLVTRTLKEVEKGGNASFEQKVVLLYNNAHYLAQTFLNPRVRELDLVTILLQYEQGRTFELFYLIAAVSLWRAKENDYESSTDEILQNVFITTEFLDQATKIKVAELFWLKMKSGCWLLVTEKGETLAALVDTKFCVVSVKNVYGDYFWERYFSELFNRFCHNKVNQSFLNENAPKVFKKATVISPIADDNIGYLTLTHLLEIISSEKLALQEEKEAVERMKDVTFMKVGNIFLYFYLASKEEGRFFYSRTYSIKNGGDDKSKEIKQKVEDCMFSHRTQLDNAIFAISNGNKNNANFWRPLLHASHAPSVSVNVLTDEYYYAEGLTKEHVFELFDYVLNHSKEARNMENVLAAWEVIKATGKAPKHFKQRKAGLLGRIFSKIFS